mmetsp:Transcript_52726/g.132645  ORF Transcript_52726/g.132645 Transcript_52726/m.132645 type:complete len:401 (+) Transcript_52726:23-1225(+)
MSSCESDAAAQLAPFAVVCAAPHGRGFAAAAGPHIFVFGPGAAPAVTELREDAASAECLVVSMAFDDSACTLAAVSTDKQLRVFRNDQGAWRLALALATPRSPSAVSLDRAGSVAVFSDKAGDVYRVSLSSDGRGAAESPPASKPAAAPAQADDGLAGKKQKTEKTKAKADDRLVPVLGHCSVLTALKLSQDEKFVLTADHDHKVRVSHFPNGYNIHTFLLGHTKFVTGVLTEGDMCVSGAADGTLRLWSRVTGEELHSHKVADDGKEGASIIVPQCLLPAHSCVVATIEKESSILIFHFNSRYLLKIDEVPTHATPLSVCATETTTARRFNVWASFATPPFLACYRVDLQSNGLHATCAEEDLPAELQPIVGRMKAFSDADLRRVRDSRPYAHLVKDGK